MTMFVERIEIKADGYDVPAIFLSPPGASSAAVIVHGYGGCKEEQLGLAFRIAERGIAVCAIDLRGHGEHPSPLDEKVMDDVSAATQHCRSYGKVIAIGHSLGGRLALLSDADFVIGISPPATVSTFSPQTQMIIKEMRSYRVREKLDVFEVFKQLPIYEPSSNGSVLLIYGGRDVPEIKETCAALEDQGENVAKIDKALHADIFLLESTFKKVCLQLDEWLIKA
jgi:acetyl esterase/lipase